MCPSILIKSEALSGATEVIHEYALSTISKFLPAGTGKFVASLFEEREYVCAADEPTIIQDALKALADLKTAIKHMEDVRQLTCDRADDAHFLGMALDKVNMAFQVNEPHRILVEHLKSHDLLSTPPQHRYGGPACLTV